MTTPILSLTEIAESSANAHIVVNTALRLLEAFASRQLESIHLTIPPVSPGESQCWYVEATATGAWAGREGDIACFVQGQWFFFPVRTGDRWYDKSFPTFSEWDGGAWVPV